MTTWQERSRKRRERRLSGDELQEAIREASERLFSVPPPEPRLTDAEIQEAYERLFGQCPTRRLRERRGDR